MTARTTRKPDTVAEAPPRRRGRPPKAAAPIGGESLLSRNVIIERASEMVKTMPLDQVSMVQLAKEFGVAPGLIHYYLGSRDDLISGVLNRYYRLRLEALPALTSNWRADVETIARSSFAMAREMPGVNLYVASHNRFRLFQAVAPGEIDYGMALFNHITSAFLQGGFSAERAALAYHLLAQYLLSSSISAAGRQSPSEHADFLRGKFGEITDDRYPAAKIVGAAFSELGAELAFDEGLKLLLNGFGDWLESGVGLGARQRESRSPRKARGASAS